MKKILLFLIKIYQILISPFLGHHKCKFLPSCSQYMVEAVEKKGLVKGVFFGIIRIIKCNPFSKSCGFDPLK